MARTLLFTLSSFMLCAAAGAAPLQQPKCVPPSQPTAAYVSEIAQLNQELGIPADYASGHDLTVEPQTQHVVVAGKDIYGYALSLAPEAADAYQRMVAAAAEDQIILQGVSGFRSVQDQYDIMARDLRNGASLEHVLTRNTPVGYSQHQTGRAIDLATPGSEPVTRAFATTAAYQWLTQHAGQFGFEMTYPPHNAQGIEFEPWHWYYQAPACD